MVQNVEVTWVETTGERRVTSETYPLPVSATFAGSVNVGSVDGDVAHDAVDSGDPVKVGFKAESTTPAAVADGDRSNLFGTLYGAAFVNLRRASDGAEVGIAANPFVVSSGTGILSIYSLAQVDEVSPQVTAEGSYDVCRITSTRDLRVCLTDSAGVNIGTAGNPIAISGSNGSGIVNIPSTFSRSDVFSAPGNGTIISLISQTVRAYGIQVTQTGGVTVWNVVLEGSLDGVTFTTIATHTNTDTSGITVFAVDKPVLYYRSRCVTITGGTDLTAVILGVA